MNVIFVLLSAVSLAAWIHLIGFRGAFWRADQRLEPSLPPPPWTGVVAIIPARDEERTIEAALAGLLAQAYPGPLSIVVVDDASTDRTVEIARDLAAAPEAKGRIEVLSAPPLAAGWTRDFFMYCDGWDKDGDYNVVNGDTVEPLPVTPPAKDAFDEADETNWRARFNTRWVPRDQFAPAP